jgi:hypothetical protein
MIEIAMMRKKAKAVAFKMVLFRWTLDLNIFQIVTKKFSNPEMTFPP